MCVCVCVCVCTLSDELSFLSLSTPEVSVLFQEELHTLTDITATDTANMSHHSPDPCLSLLNLSLSLSLSLSLFSPYCTLFHITFASHVFLTLLSKKLLLSFSYFQVRK